MPFTGNCHLLESCALQVQEGCGHGSVRGTDGGRGDDVSIRVQWGTRRVNVDEQQSVEARGSTPPTRVPVG